MNKRAVASGDLAPRASHVRRRLISFSAVALDQLFFSIWRWPDELEFEFALKSEAASGPEAVKIPTAKPEGDRQRRDGLWTTTCFEVFFGGLRSPSYVEVNLSPSGDWNLYAFADYRQGRLPVADAEVRLLETLVSPRTPSLAVRGSVRPLSPDSMLRPLLRSGPLVMGANAVLEYENGSHEYWALTHAGDKPDFHLRRGFSLTLE